MTTVVLCDTDFFDAPCVMITRAGNYTRHQITDKRTATLIIDLPNSIRRKALVEVENWMINPLNARKIRHVMRVGSTFMIDLGDQHPHALPGSAERWHELTFVEDTAE